MTTPTASGSGSKKKLRKKGTPSSSTALAPGTPSSPLQVRKDKGKGREDSEDIEQDSEDLAPFDMTSVGEWFGQIGRDLHECQETIKAQKKKSLKLEDRMDRKDEALKTSIELVSELKEKLETLEANPRARNVRINNQLLALQTQATHDRTASENGIRTVQLDAAGALANEMRIREILVDALQAGSQRSLLVATNQAADIEGLRQLIPSQIEASKNAERETTENRITVVASEISTNQQEFLLLKADVALLQRPIHERIQSRVTAGMRNLKTFGNNKRDALRKVNYSRLKEKVAGKLGITKAVETLNYYRNYCYRLAELEAENARLQVEQGKQVEQGMEEV